MRFKQVFDGEWIRPLMRGWRCKCCKCGLVHTWQFRTVGRNVEFRAWRHPRKTLAHGSRVPYVRRPMQKLIFDRVVDALLAQRAGVVTRKATLYVAPDYVVTATLRCKPDRRCKRTEIVLKIGAPNFVERQFVKACKKAGEPFPVKKIQLKFYPRKR